MATAPSIDPNYVPVQPLVQYRGTDPFSNKQTFYRRDQNGVLVFRYNGITNAWDSFKSSGPFPIPADLQPAMSTSDMNALTVDFIDSNVFRPKTEYIKIGDEPKDLDTSAGVVSIKKFLDDIQYSNLKKMLSFMPRMYFRDWFVKNVLPGLRNVDPVVWYQSKVTRDPIYGTLTAKGDYDDLIWSAFIDVFNEANLEYVNKQQINPWDWEDEKVEYYYLAANQDAATAITQEIESYKDLDDPKAVDLLKQYQSLPPLGDTGLEITRQNAVRELLKQKEYDSVQGIIDAYRYAQNTVLGNALVKPIPYDIVDQETGTVVKATTSS